MKAILLLTALLLAGCSNGRGSTWANPDETLGKFHTVGVFEGNYLATYDDEENGVRCYLYAHDGNYGRGLACVKVR